MKNIIPFHSFLNESKNNTIDLYAKKFKAAMKTTPSKQKTMDWIDSQKELSDKEKVELWDTVTHYTFTDDNPNPYMRKQFVDMGDRGRGVPGKKATLLKFPKWLK